MAMQIEHWWFTARLRLRSILLRNRVEQELDEELQFHLEHKIEEGIIVVYLAVVPSMVVVTMLAAYVPARRAARIAPTQALRYE